MFDHFKITVQSGKGGDGAIAFRHEKSIARGGPYGGNGGRGGSVYIQSSKDVETLANFNFRQHFFATDGENGKTKLCNGKDGKDVFVMVPVGTIITDENGHLVADLDKDGERVLVAKGGRGGRGNACFKSSTRRTPNIAENGAPGSRKILSLELRLLADVGLVGFPNAGKSSLISAMTNAKSLVASYKFSTLEPVLGVCFCNRKTDRFVLADIPGLIEGASQGKGMGYDFLRHILRCRIIAHCIDPTDTEHGSIEESLAAINKEINEYSEEFGRKKHIIVFTKMDLVDDCTEIDAFIRKHEKEYPIFETSCMDEDSLQKLALSLLAVVKEESLNERKNRFLNDEKEVVYSANDFDNGQIPEYQIIQDAEGRYIIQGERVIRTKRLINLSTDEGMDRLIEYLDRIGINERLRELEAEPGATVVLDDFEFEYQP